MVKQQSKYEMILKALQEFNRPAYPLEISLRAELNHSTTRVYLRKLLKARVVVQPFPGTYVTSPIHGVGRDSSRPCGFESRTLLPRVQNLVLVYSKAGWIRESVQEVRRVGSSKIRILYGKKRGKISVFISNPWGLDLEATLLVLDVAQSMIYRTTRIPLDIGLFQMVNMEWLNDVQGIRLEGFKTLTVRGFTGALEKIYNKDQGVRREVKIPQGSPMEEVLALWRGGIPLSQIVQGQQQLVQEIRSLRDLLARYLERDNRAASRTS